MRRALIFFLLQILVFASGEENSQEATCNAQQTCRSCLQTPTCVWCMSPDKAGFPARCITRRKYNEDGFNRNETWCPRFQVLNEFSKATIVENAPLSQRSSRLLRDAVQIQPQKMKLRLRIGEEYRVTLRYSQAEDYPVDLYYLMDLSSSMVEYRDRLSELGFKLAETMKKLTSNFRLGFGSFVDKVVLPMTSTMPEKLKSPCNPGITFCAPPYSYKNQMPLTESVEHFKERVKGAPVSGNLDSPEGGLDALMQVMVCKDEIGWRPKARHLVVFSTDASYHIAGDGKLAGIVEPNDGLCHLDKEGFYTHSLLQDYPSISQIRRKAAEHNVNIIFAVTEQYNETYSQLSRSIGASSVGQLSSRSDNVVAIVSAEYEALMSSVELMDNATRFVNMKYYSRCSGTSSELREGQKCEGKHRAGDVIEFEIVLKALECPSNPNDWRQTLQIKPRSLNESLTIDLELLCECPCDKVGNEGNKCDAVECNEHGDLVCGVCSCHDGFYGKRCECESSSATRADLSAEVTENCVAPNDTRVCSDHGTCKCGQCVCNTRTHFSPPESSEYFKGDYCECDNFSCERDGGKICGGRGKCECGKCICSPGWGGSSCACRQTNTTCTPPGDDAEICNGRGDCICGRCDCRVKNGIQYAGQYCEDCPTCPGQRCDELKDCAECEAYNAGPLAANACRDCRNHSIEIVDKVEDDPEQDEIVGARVCRTPGDAGCTFVFKYKVKRGDNTKAFDIEVEKERVCPAPVNVMGVAIGVIVSTVILGFLVLIIWKLLTMAHDQREFAKFEKERAMAKWDRGDNPLYRQATSNFENPTFGEAKN